MKVYHVNVSGSSDYALEDYYDYFLEAFDSEDKANEYTESKRNAVKDIYEKQQRQDYACSACDHEDKCMYCDWNSNEYNDAFLEIVTSNGKKVILDCNLYDGDKPEFEVHEINVL